MDQTYYVETQPLNPVLWRKQSILSRTPCGPAVSDTTVIGNDDHDGFLLNLFNQCRICCEKVMRTPVRRSDIDGDSPSAVIYSVSGLMESLLSNEK